MPVVLCALPTPTTPGAEQPEGAVLLGEEESAGDRRCGVVWYGGYEALPSPTTPGAKQPEGAVLFGEKESAGDRGSGGADVGVCTADHGRHCQLALVVSPCPAVKLIDLEGLMLEYLQLTMDDIVNVRDSGVRCNAVRCGTVGCDKSARRSGGADVGVCTADHERHCQCEVRFSQSTQKLFFLEKNLVHVCSALTPSEFCSPPPSGEHRPIAVTGGVELRRTHKEGQPVACYAVTHSLLSSLS
ncbi:unnamed protein product [Closterium sp. NIES-53]